MPEDRRLPDRRGTDHQGLPAACAVRDPHGRPGVARRRLGEPAKLAACYRNSLQLAAEHGVRTIAFPGISTGVYGYPIEDATRLALTTVQDCLAALPGIEEVRFVTFGERATEVAARARRAATRVAADRQPAGALQPPGCLGRCRYRGILGVIGGRDRSGLGRRDGRCLGRAFGHRPTVEPLQA